MPKKRKKAGRTAAKKKNAELLARLARIENDIIRAIDEHTVIVQGEDRTFSYIPGEALGQLLTDLVASMSGMGVYISENGDWGDLDSLRLVFCPNMKEADYDALAEMTQFELLEYSEEHNGRTPSEYLTHVNDLLEATRGMSLIK